MEVSKPQQESVEPIEEFGEKLIGSKYNVWYKDDIEDKGLKQMMVRAKTMKDAAKKALGLAANKFI